MKNEELRIAFDGDAVLFSDESEVIAKQHGLNKFFESEANKVSFDTKFDWILEIA